MDSTFKRVRFTSGGSNMFSDYLINSTCLEISRSAWRMASRVEAKVVEGFNDDVAAFTFTIAGEIGAVPAELVGL